MATNAEPLPGVASPAQSERRTGQVSAEWADAASVEADRSEAVAEATWGRQATAAIVARARVGPGLTVLGLIGGDGEPALALAKWSGRPATSRRRTRAPGGWRPHLATTCALSRT